MTVRTRDINVIAMLMLMDRILHYYNGGKDMMEMVELKGLTNQVVILQRIDEDKFDDQDDGVYYRIID